jgi:hypothetical protein
MRAGCRASRLYGCKKEEGIPLDRFQGRQMSCIVRLAAA